MKYPFQNHYIKTYKNVLNIDIEKPIESIKINQKIQRIYGLYYEQKVHKDLYLESYYKQTNLINRIAGN